MVQNLCSRLIQPTASLSPGLFWPRSFGLSLSKPQLNLTWKCPYKYTHRLSAACWTRERLLHMLAHALFSIIYQTFRPKDERCIGGKMTCCTREPEISSIFSTSSIAGISPFNPLDWSLTNSFSTSFPHKFHKSLVLILTEMLIWKEHDGRKYGDFSVQSQSFRFFARSKLRVAPKQTTIIGPVYLRTKLWKIYTSS